MKSLILKPELRQLEIIQLLNNDKQELTIAEVASILNCNERVIKEDITKINSAASGQYKIYTKDDKIRIKFKKNIGVDYVTHIIMKNTFSFKIIEKSFFAENLSLEKAADELYLSPSSLYRYISMINEKLINDFDVKIVTCPFQIVGDEERIRYFYLQYFLERYLIGDWPFEHIIPENYVEKILQSRIEETNFKMSFHKYHQLKYMLALKLIRIRKEFRLTLNNADLTIYEDMVEDFNAKFYNQSVGLKYTSDILFELSDCLLHSSTQFSFSEYITRVNDDEEYNRIFLKIYKIISILTSEFDVNPIVKDSLIFKLHMAYINGIYDIDANHIVHDSKKKFLNDLNDSFRPFFNRSKELFTEFLLSTKKSVDENLLNQLIYIIFTNWDNLPIDLFGKSKRIRVLVLSKYDHAHAKLIKDFMGLEDWRGPNLKVTLMDDGEFADLEVNALKERFDIIIGNFSLTAYDELNYMKVNDMPSFRDFEVLHGEINKFLAEANEEKR